MWNYNRKLKPYGKMLSILLLMNCLTYPIFGEQQTRQSLNFTENETRLYSDYEIERLIEELTEAALEAIEQAASEAARAAILASLDRETAALREAQRWRAEAEQRQQAISEAKQTGRKNTLLGVLIGILSGLAVGVTGTLLIGR
jgi:methionyl-tRNA synthetase